MISGYTMKKISTKADINQGCLMTQGLRVIYQDHSVCFMKTTECVMRICLNLQIEEVISAKGKGDLDKLLRGSETWTIFDRH